MPQDRQLSWVQTETDTNTITDALREMFWPRLFPQQKRSIIEFAEQEFELPKGPRKGMMFDRDFMPILQFPFDAMMDKYWRKIAIVGPTQTGKSLIGTNIPLVYYLFELQEDVIFGLPNMDLAKGIWDEKIKPVIMGTRYKDQLPTTGAGSRGGSFSQVTLRNGTSLRFVGAGGGDAQRSSHTARIILITEVDKMDDAGDASEEADPVRQIEMRADSFKGTSQVVMECTVTHDDGRIWQEAMVVGSGCRGFVPCPSCGTYQALSIDRITYDSRDVIAAEETARYQCIGCDAQWDESMRRQALDRPVPVHRGQTVDEMGQVVGALPRTRTFGMHYSVLYSPMQTLGETAAEHLASELSENKDAKKAFCQSKLALPWKDEEVEGNRLSFAYLEGRRKASDCVLKTVPEWTDWLIFTVDVQKRMLYWHCDAFRANGTSQVVEYGVTDIVDDTDLAIVRALDQTMDIANEGWAGAEEGTHYIPRLNMVDTGYRYDVIAKWLRGRHRWFGVKGVGKGQGQKMTGEKATFQIPGIVQCKRQPDGNLIWFCMVDDTKAIVHDRYFINDPTAPGYTYVPGDVTRGYLMHLTAEQRKYVDKNDGWEWEKVRRRNDWLDCRSYSVVAAMYLMLKEGKAARELQAKADANAAAAAAEQAGDASQFPRPSFLVPEKPAVVSSSRKKRKAPAGEGWLNSRGRYFS